MSGPATKADLDDALRRQLRDVAWFVIVILAPLIIAALTIFGMIVSARHGH